MDENETCVGCGDVLPVSKCIRIVYSHQGEVLIVEYLCFACALGCGEHSQQRRAVRVVLRRWEVEREHT